MNLVDIYMNNKKAIKGQIKLNCRSCIEKFGRKLKFVDTGTKILCGLSEDGNENEYDIRDVSDCLRDYNGEMLSYAIALKWFRDNIGVFDPLKY